MARRKQSLPARAKGNAQQANGTDVQEAVAIETTKPRTTLHVKSSVLVYPPEYALEWVADVAEIGLEATVYDIPGGGLYREPLELRLHLSTFKGDFLMGLRALSVEDVRIEVFEQCGSSVDTMDTKEVETRLVVTGYLDCPQESIVAFVSLFKTGHISVKPHLRAEAENVSCRLTIGVTKKVFDDDQGLLGGAKSVWIRYMLKVMKWLRPDLHTSEGIYGASSEGASSGSCQRSWQSVDEDGMHKSEGRSQQAFDPSLLYEAIRPDQNGPPLASTPPQLLAKLRPYQSRAAFWMVQRESLPEKSGQLASDCMKWPFCSEFVSLDKKTVLFYNPFSGAFSKVTFKSFPDIRGGILADEMGLGKTVELLACIMTNSSTQHNDAAERASEELELKLKRRKQERISCPCGATDDSYDGIWVQCDVCDAWHHASCVGFGMEYDYPEFFEKEIASRKRELKSSDRARVTKRKGITKMGAQLKEERYVVNQDYVCGVCAKLIGSVEVEGVCGATLIVCPSSILGQWQEEIARHTEKGALNVLVYEGFQRGNVMLSDDQISRSKYGKVVGAHELAKADIVLTTYNTLQADLSHDMDGDNSQQRSMRFVKRYPVVPTPLTRMKWWRVCLDEAQMVESSAARATEMAKRLNAEIRWCITGTPIQCSLDDLQGLLSFLDLQPFSDSFWWSKVLKEPYEKYDCGALTFAHNYLKRFMWRSSKVQVSHELGLPPQEESLMWLTFSPIEAHFYRRQHERCAKKALDALSGFIQREKSSACEDRTLTHAEAGKVMHPLLSLRQACCHPQIGSSGLRSLQKKPMTMDEVLKVLIEKAKTEGEEAQRALVGALNGLAGLKILEHDLVAAVNLYREAILVAEDNAEEFDIDPLQKLHVLHNLQEVLNMPEKDLSEVPNMQEGSSVSRKRERGQSHDDNTTGPAMKRQQLNPGGAIAQICEIESKDGESLYARGVPRTLRDGLLHQQCQEISAKFMSSFNGKLSANEEDYKNAHYEVCQLTKDLEDMHGGTWWLDVLTPLPNDSRPAKQLVQKIKASLLQKDYLSLSRGGHENASSLALRFHDINGLKYILIRELDAISTFRKNLLEKISELQQMMATPSAEDVERAGSCSSCAFSTSNGNQKGPICAICEADQVYQMYENRLFLLQSSAANIGDIVSLDDAFAAQQRLLNQKRINTLKMATGSYEPSRENVDDEGNTRDVARVRVNRAPSEIESILRLIRSHTRQSMDGDMLAASTKHLELFEAMRKEYAQARLLAVSQRMVLRALDELNMAKTRLRLRYPGEQASNASSEIFVLHSEEIPQRNAQLTGEKFIALDDLRRAKGQIRYLKGLAMSRDKSMQGPQSTSSQAINGEILAEGRPEKNSDAKPGTFEGVVDQACPVCQERLGWQMMVLPCGHMLCCKCLMTMAEHKDSLDTHLERKRISCPSCRCCAHIDNIALIDNGLGETSYTFAMNKLQHEDFGIEASFTVDGAYGTKMEAVVRRIVRVQTSDPHARFLVFSTWNDVLDVVEHSLLANNIGFIRAKGRRQLNGAIRRFKAKDEAAKVLLLLVQHGGNGLNLIEAQHVILVEPLLNPGAEAQAVNRVHRIGQHHATFVHKFLIKETVEESIYKLSQLKSQSPGRASMGRNSNQEVSALTIKDLKMLFTSDTNDTSEMGDSRAPTGETRILDNSETRSENVMPEAAPSTMLNLRELPPAAAAAAAAESRLQQALHARSAGCGPCLTPERAAVSVNQLD